MKKYYLLGFLALFMMSGCGNTESSGMTKDKYATVFHSVAHTIYNYSVPSSNLKKLMDTAENSDFLLSAATMISMMSEVCSSDKFEYRDETVVHLRANYEGSDMEFYVYCSYSAEDDLICGMIRSYSEVFAPEDSMDFVTVKYDFEKEKILSFDLSYVDRDGFMFSQYRDDVIKVLNQEQQDEEFEDVSDKVYSLKTDFESKMNSCVEVEDDFSEEIAKVIADSPSGN